MRKLLQKLLRFFSKSVLLKYKPVIVAITGSVGKTSTKEAIYHVLKTHFGEKEVRRNRRNYNNEIGVPLTIFGLETGGSSVFLWFLKFIKILWMIVFKIKYPSFLVLEMGADRPGDIKYLMDFVRPKVGVITALGEIPVHVEFFESPRQVANEKRNLISSLNESGIAILNYDDEAVRQMAEGISAKILTYGLKDRADIRATNYDLKVNSNGSVSELNFKLEFSGSSVPAKLVNVLGVQHLYSTLAAASVGITFNMNLVEIVEALKEFHPLPGRMRLIKGIKNTLIVDDTYNAALLSMEAALESLKIFENRRKIVVLGDMLEIGKYTPEAHKKIGKKASEIADLIFTVGSRSKFIAEEAKKQGFSENKIFQFMVSSDAAIKVQEEIKENDIILIKGSRAMKMEKIVKEIMAEPEKAGELLVG
ncbi:MAG: UDP-N-acetylmuramoyl-tripeptide--D-alanyl-D-alanine ligase [bacterium]|nr:UDP-N-acetylmuramoyl-tripeptide--D-alanyl-D-alanine ligase [bacterium]